MKILVLGNSNSIAPLGYLTGLLAQFPTAEITNQSVGHSPGTQFAYYGAMDFSPFDLVIFDSVANDELFIEEVGGWEFLRDFYYELFSTIASQTRLVILGFFRRSLDAPVTDVHYLHADLAALAGAQFVDVREFILKNGPSIVAKGTALMADEAHPHRAVVQQLGHHLGKLIADTPAPPRAARSFSANFHGYHAADRFAGAVEYRQTSLMARHLAILRDGDAIAFEVERPVVGFYIDMSATKGFLQLEGSRGVLNKTLLFDDGDSALQMRFVPLRAPFPVRRLVCVDMCHTYEPSLYSQEPGADPLQPVVSLHGVSCWSGKAHDDLPVARRGATTFRPSRTPVRSADDLELQAPDLPVGRGWKKAWQRADGLWCRFTSSDTPSALLFDFEAGRYSIELRILGAVSPEALMTLQASANGQKLSLETTFDAKVSFYRSSIKLEVERAGPVDLLLTVPLTRYGVGIEINSVRVRRASVNFW